MPLGTFWKQRSTTASVLARMSQTRVCDTGGSAPAGERARAGRMTARGLQQGAVSIRDLVRHALRHRPDHIVVGEVRGGKAADLLQALNTGHGGSLTTVHANNAESRSPRSPPPMCWRSSPPSGTRSCRPPSGCASASGPRWSGPEGTILSRCPVWACGSRPRAR